MDMIEIDGATGEAGGQILRTATGLSAITGKPFHIYNIRKGRCTQGMRPQHLTGVKAVAQLCNAKLKHAEIDSTELEFIPGKITGGKHRFDIGTAGSIPLLLQSLIIPATHANMPVELDLYGGTDVKWSPTIDYFRYIFVKYAKMFGIDVSVDIIKRGFYPKGGGHIIMRIMPAMPTPLVLTECTELTRIDAWGIATNDMKKAQVAERIMKAFEQEINNIAKNIAKSLLGSMFSDLTIGRTELRSNEVRDTTKHNKTRNKIPDCREVQYIDSLSTGCTFFAHTHHENGTCLGSCAIGEKGKSAEQIGKDVALMLKKQIDSKACVDENMADQILPFMALAAPHGESRIKAAEITDHVRTNIWVIEKFMPVKFEIDEKNRIIDCRQII
ncbi:MAG: RNA 3'-terminal phosphate cyclase [Candidatus Aenigmarchaeota archaeon]|nr:RNA 3'-terminal phosphate cyclase [Candidatus Aenigmarchaeota archaeon]